MCACSGLNKFESGTYSCLEALCLEGGEVIVRALSSVRAVSLKNELANLVNICYVFLAKNRMQIHSLGRQIFLAFQ